MSVLGIEGLKGPRQCGQTWDSHIPLGTRGRKNHGNMGTVPTNSMFGQGMGRTKEIQLDCETKDFRWDFP